MARFYSNENFPIPVVVALRALGHDVVTIQERGRANESTPDVDVLTFATSESRAVLTLNRKDFYELHRQSQDHAGIVVCVVELDFSRLAQQIHDSIQDVGELAGMIIRVPPKD